ncbi:helicase-associated domain-containing protein [Actinoplanes sp. NBC_00393]|uniref:helicase-associated domain-containing protein n=1 Tax=Actinoplanes sp. NBC_00393 TaxID=2975953 RepID=UPI002E1EF916
MPRQSLAVHLKTLTRQELTELLSARRDATLEPAPKTLLKLAERLLTPSSLAGAMSLLNLPQLQVTEAAAALGDGFTPVEMAALLGVPEKDLTGVLAELCALAVIWPQAGGYAAEHLTAVLPNPLGTGPRAGGLLFSLTMPQLRRIALTLGVPDERTKPAMIGALTSWLAVPENVRGLVAQAPARVRETLGRIARRPPGPFGMPGIMFGTPAEVPEWAVDRGLVVPSGWGDGQMPREVALALRAGDAGLFDPQPPAVDPAPVSAELVEREAAAAATDTLALITAVCGAVDQAPVALLKTGGLGVRELRRLAKASGQSEERTRFAIELITAGGLVSLSDAGVALAGPYDEFAAADPADQLLEVIQDWLQMPACPLSGVEERALYWSEDDEAALTELRSALLRTLGAALPSGQALDPVAAARQIVWHRPTAADIGPALDEFVDGVWREAHLLGLLAHGAVTELCRRILEGSAEAVRRQAATMVPEPRTTVLLQNDLTAVATGTPSAALLALLDEVADPESRSGAWTWRFSPGSVRRALDGGADPQELIRRLGEIAEGGRLPQPLTYLVNDVARRHGQVQVRPVGCCLCSEDEALLSEILATRSLKALQLVRLAPTVLASGKPQAETLVALRAAGYAPSSVRADGTPAIEVAKQRRPVVDSDPEEPAGYRLADPAKLARLLN